MPIGLVSDEEFNRESEKLKESHLSSDRSKLSSDRSKLSSDRSKPKVEILEKKGRKDGDNNVPSSLRNIISETHLLDGRSAALSLANQFGVSSSSVSAYAKGATSTASYNNPSKEIISHINSARKRAVKKASKTLNEALGAITQEKLDYADAKDLSSIAKDMSAIIKNLEPQSSEGDSTAKAPQFVIYAPQFKKEESFEVITVNE